MTRWLIIILTALLLLPFTVPAQAGGRCSEGANCTACSTCSGCGHCARNGGTCSVCRPALYRSTSYNGFAHPVPVPGAARLPAISIQRVPIQRTRVRRTTRRTTSNSRSTTTVPKIFSGKVVGVSDGDTITVLHNRQPVKVRLEGIDCPESRQAFGTRAKQFTSGLVFGKTVTVVSSGRDRYNRVLGWIELRDGRWLNNELVKAGLAWWYRQYNPSDTRMAAQEQEARKARRGLWSDANPVPPWEWRRSRRTATRG
jgi:micrococcal nuclease